MLGCWAGRFLPQALSSVSPCRHTSNSEVLEQNVKKGLLDDDTVEIVSFPFPLSFHSVQVVVFRLIDGTCSLSLSFFFDLSSSRHEREAILASHTHSGHVSFVPLHLRFPVSRMHGGREEGIFIRRNEARLPSAVFLCSSCRIAHVDDVFASKRRRLMLDLIERGWPSFQYIAQIWNASTLFN